ncbi:hypothetical protein [Burkholderia territorii]|uniref:hypothetical protein n=1 Tax=Burkholderia territorii TaxID=1503055 RepID=UPI0012DA2B00|nr:hypothetical protein [Burkholderia territorii]
MEIELSQYCRETIYRAIWLFPVDYAAIFLHAKNREDANIKITMLSVFFLSGELGVVDVGPVYSYKELLDDGVSDDQDLRIFEMSSREGVVTQWVEQPLFLSIDQSLIGKWISMNFSRALSAAVAVTR